MPSSVTIFNVTKLRPGQVRIVYARLIFIVGRGFSSFEFGRKSIAEVTFGRVLTQHLEVFGDGIDVLVDQLGDTGDVMRREARNERLMFAKRPRRMLRHAIEKQITDAVEVHLHAGDERPNSLTPGKGKEPGVHLLVESKEIVWTSRIDRATLRREYFLELGDLRRRNRTNQFRQVRRLEGTANEPAFVDESHAYRRDHGADLRIDIHQAFLRQLPQRLAYR